jgi:hypothetical protein
MSSASSGKPYEEVTYNSPGGATIGQSASVKIAFHGSVPVIQAGAAANLATTVFSAAFTGMWAFSSSTAAKLVITRINSVLTALRDKGILAT